MRLLDLAPHASLPPTDGADKRSWHLYAGLVPHCDSAIFLARKTLVRQQNDTIAHSAKQTWRDRKGPSALVSLATGSDYWSLRHLGPGVRRTIRSLASEPFDVLLVNYLYSSTLLKGLPGGRRLLIDTQNYDPAVFGALRDASQNPLIRLLCRRAIRLSVRQLAALPQGAVLIHVSEADAENYRRDRPDLAHVVIENGCSVHPRIQSPNYQANQKVIMFVGSLSAQMNQDALNHFAIHFWPALRQSTQFRVVGSRPPAGIKSLCARHSWQLFANVSEARLESLYAEAHFAVLPFAYGEGSKLKLMEACGRGVPVLATTAGLRGIASLPPLVFPTDSPEEWCRRVRETRTLEASLIDRTIEFARNLSWPRLADRLADICRAAPVCSW